MSGAETDTIHASCVALPYLGEMRGVLIEGRSGAGKSDLALRLIDRGGRLVSDDYTELRNEGGVLVAASPGSISGKIEVRGLGIVELPHLAEARVGLMIGLDDAVDRMPLEPRSRTLAGISIPFVSLSALEGSAPIKVEIAVGRLWNAGG